jgi:hypothetical protein
MFIAHIPSGYIMSIALLKRIRHVPVPAAIIVAVGISGAVAPDLDMAYFHLVDHRQTHHHKYVTHWPLLWITLAAAFALWFSWQKRSRAAFLGLVFSLGGVLHMVLDSFVGDIWWFAPFIDKSYALFNVPARFKPWWLNFVLHWSFAAEAGILVWALLLYRRRCLVR